MAPGLKRACFGVAAGLLLLVCACEPEATPLPVNLPTLPPPSPTAGTPMPLRYAVAPDALPYLTYQDRSLISASAQLIELDTSPIAADLGTRYEIVVALGDLPDGTRTGSPLQINLSMNIALPPLDDPRLVDILRRAIDPQKLVSALALPGVQAVSAAPSDTLSIRTDLANAGYPDGFDLTIAAAPAAAALTQLLGAVNIETRVVTSADEPTHLSFVNGQPPPSNVIPLYTLPISYHAVDGLNITFTPNGFPIVQK
ncbi:MAG: hypothetical protein GC204_16715 [Chloroflexi bacterium]|nr:hypothetical protein [Chloroflexota bacterium]